MFNGSPESASGSRALQMTDDERAAAYETTLRLGDIFIPSSTQRRRNLNSNSRFVHYTDADAAISIMRNQRFWMRSVRAMNDYSEIHHGRELVESVFPKFKKDFFSAVNACHDGAAESAIKQIEELYVSFYMNTYVACISEHDLSENEHGRLSMWRAYGKLASGVALVFNPQPLLMRDSIGIFSVPTLYFDEDNLVEEFQLIVKNISENRKYLESLPKAYIEQAIFHLFTTMFVGLKHPGFREEKEWRIVYIDEMFNSPVIEKQVRSVRGVPQRVFEIRMQDDPAIRFVGVEPKSLIERVIIGPSHSSLVLRYALTDVMDSVGIPRGRLVASGIPMRT
ncbi:hypothetical protein BN1110_03717 [bacterium YEK0313]|nr:hypothetical protein BN1110_03717 [bacterium YEK0313]